MKIGKPGQSKLEDGKKDTRLDLVPTTEIEWKECSITKAVSSQGLENATYRVGNIKHRESGKF